MAWPRKLGNVRLIAGSPHHDGRKVSLSTWYAMCPEPLVLELSGETQLGERAAEMIGAVQRQRYCRRRDRRSTGTAR